MLAQAFLTAFLDLVGFSIIFPLFPEMLRHYMAQAGGEGALGALVEVSTRLAGSGGNADALVSALFGGILGSLYSLAQFAFAPIWGTISDRMGRRPTLLITLTGTAIAHAGWVLAGSFEVLVLARIFGGIMAGNVSTISAVAADVSSKEGRSRAMGLVGAAIGLGFIVGPAIGGISYAFKPAEHWPGLVAYGVNPFSGPAAISLALSLVNLVIVAVAFPETLSRERRSESTGLRSANPLALFRSTGVEGVGRVNFVYFVFQTAFSAMEFSLVFLTVERFRYGPMDNAVMFVFVGFVIASVQGGALRPLSKRFPETRLAIGGMSLVTVGMLGVAGSSRPAHLFPALFVLAAGSALVMPSLSALASRYASSERQGLALGMFRSAGALSRAVGPMLGGAIYWQLGSASPTLVAALLLTVPITLAFSLPEPS